MVIKLTPKHGYGPNCYVVATTSEWYDIVIWMLENQVDHWHLSTGPEGYGFQVKSKVEWFLLRWT